MCLDIFEFNHSLTVDEWKLESYHRVFLEIYIRNCFAVEHVFGRKLNPA